ncbi:MAG: response regulator [Chthoniobacterales bacterium]
MSMATPCRILTVDDEASVTLSLKFVFPKPRYEVLCVASGDEALANLEADASVYDVIIVDQKMPNLSGVELVEAIRQRNIPGEIIVLSAHLTSEMRAAYDRLKVHAIFPKPFDLNELRATVGHLAAASAAGNWEPDDIPPR